MPSTDSPVNIDADLRRMDANQLGGPIGDAINNADHTQLAYFLGRLDAKITGSDEEGNSSLYRLEVQLRNAICAALNLYPNLYERPSAVPERPVDVINGGDNAA